MGFLIHSPRLLLQLLLLLLLLTIATPPVAAQSPSSARALDAALQAAAFRALAARPRTGIVYNVTVPSTLTGITASALRLRSGSLRRRGVPGPGPGYIQFILPPGIVVQPHVERVVLVHHDLGGRSEQYYPAPAGYAYLAPVVGLLAYDAANLSAAGVPELEVVVAAGAPISVAFEGVRAVKAAGGSAGVPRCVVFGLDGGTEFRDLEGTNVCTTYRQGHVAIVVNSSEIAPVPAPAAPTPTGVAPAPPPDGVIYPPIPTKGGGGKKGSGSDAWKIAVGVVGGAAALGLVAALVLCLVRYKRDKKLQVMERNAEVGETLRMAQVGRTQAPVALGTRTQPVIENDYAAQ